MREVGERSGASGDPTGVRRRPWRRHGSALGFAIAGALGLALVQVYSSSCTNAGLVTLGPGGPGRPDRLELQGRACVPLAAGESFPVKVVFAIENGPQVEPGLRSAILDGLNDVVTQFTTPAHSFAFVGHNTMATGIEGAFVNDTRVTIAIGNYASRTEPAGPRSHRSALRLAESILSGDMQTGCRGLVARTRYLVVLVMTGADQSCANPVFNPGIAAKCNAFLSSGDLAQCTGCELSRTTESLRQLATKYGAGEVVVQPVFVDTDSSPTPSFDEQTALYQADVIARAGGSTLVTTDPAGVRQRLASLNYASLQRALKLKRLIVMNRNAPVRAGRVLVDSDGDGLSDEEEAAIGTNPLAADTDLDGLGDGVELKMGFKPQPPDAGGVRERVSACNSSDDTDGDRLNDCEERVLGTDGCISDSDGDGLPDLVEFLGNSNPLIAEDLADDDRDGLSNIEEITVHSDPWTADIAFQRDRGVGYRVLPAPPTPDGRACYDLTIFNVALVETRERPDPSGAGEPVPVGNNEVHIYFQVGRDNDPRGTGIGALRIEQERFLDAKDGRPAFRERSNPLTFAPEDFGAGF